MLPGSRALQWDKWHHPKIWAQRRIANEGFIAVKSD